MRRPSCPTCRRLCTGLGSGWSRWPLRFHRLDRRLQLHHLLRHLSHLVRTDRLSRHRRRLHLLASKHGRAGQTGAWGQQTKELVAERFLPRTGLDWQWASTLRQVACRRYLLERFGEECPCSGLPALAAKRRMRSVGERRGAARTGGCADYSGVTLELLLDSFVA